MRNPTPAKRSRTYGKPIPTRPNLRLEIAARQLPSIILAGSTISNKSEFRLPDADEAGRLAIRYADALMRADRETAQ